MFLLWKWLNTFYICGGRKEEHNASLTGAQTHLTMRSWWWRWWYSFANRYKENGDRRMAFLSTWIPALALSLSLLRRPMASLAAVQWGCCHSKALKACCRYGPPSGPCWHCLRQITLLLPGYDTTLPLAFSACANPPLPFQEDYKRKVPQKKRVRGEEEEKRSKAKKKREEKNDKLRKSSLTLRAMRRAEKETLPENKHHHCCGLNVQPLLVLLK